MNNTFSINPLLGWSWDSFKSFRDGVFDPTTFDQYIEDYRQSFDDNEIGKLINDLPINFNLGGSEEKTKLETTDKPLGVFDFSLASKGLYRVQEYFSEKLKNEQPNLFSEFNLPKGVVPPDLVNKTVIQGKNIFTYTDKNGKTYTLTQQQKGTASIDQGVSNAKLKFATKTKDVYLKFKREGGKVRYVEIYSLFYFTRTGSDLEYAIAHLPAIMVANYFEQRGIGVRFYMTRFVFLNGLRNRVRVDSKDGNLKGLPLASEYNNDILYNGLFIQPIQVKDFYEEIDYVNVFAISSKSSSSSIYNTIAKASLDQELINGIDIDPFGSPDWKQRQYFEGFERYKNKYKKYVKEGYWKSKEVVAEGQIMFHSLSLAYSLNTFIIRFCNDNLISGLTTHTIVKDVFEWWMRFLGNRLKIIVLIQVSTNLKKDIQKYLSEVQENIETIIYKINNYNQIVSILATDLDDSKESFKAFIRLVLSEEGLPITYDNGKIEANYKSFLVKVITEANTFADDGYFATPKEDKEERQKKIDEAIQIITTL